MQYLPQEGYMICCVLTKFCSVEHFVSPGGQHMERTSGCFFIFKACNKLTRRIELQPSVHSKMKGPFLSPFQADTVSLMAAIFKTPSFRFSEVGNFFFWGRQLSML